MPGRRSCLDKLEVKSYRKFHSVSIEIVIPIMTVIIIIVFAILQRVSNANTYTCFAMAKVEMTSYLRCKVKAFAICETIADFRFNIRRDVLMEGLVPFSSYVCKHGDTPTIIFKIVVKPTVDANTYASIEIRIDLASM